MVKDLTFDTVTEETTETKSDIAGERSILNQTLFDNSFKKLHLTGPLTVCREEECNKMTLSTIEEMD